MFDVSQITNLDSGFCYTKLNTVFEEHELKKTAESLRKRFAIQTKAWNADLHTQWAIRHYLSIKMILSASVMLTSLDYSYNNNIRIVEPYLTYYSLLNTARALIFTLPDVEWNDGTIISLSHETIINLTFDAINKINNNKAKQVKEELRKAKIFRELFSYRFPSEGLKQFDEEMSNFQEVVSLCTLFCEIAQFNSEILQKSYKKNVRYEFEFNEQILSRGFVFESKDFSIIDFADYHRIGYIDRKMKKPFNLLWMMTEGMVEDFFGAWCSSKESDKNMYNPDENWRIIYPVP